MDRGRESFLRSWSIATNHIALTPRRVPCHHQERGGGLTTRWTTVWVYYINYVYIRKAGDYHLSVGDQHKYFLKISSSALLKTRTFQNHMTSFQNHDVTVGDTVFSRWDTVYRFGVGLNNKGRGTLAIFVV